MTFVDQVGNRIELLQIPKRVVSLVPSLTETLFDLGLGDKIVGVTKYCVEPKGLVERIPKVGGTKKVDIEFIRSLEPDIIIANKEENTKEQIEELMNFVPVWTSYIVTIDDVIGMLNSFGLIFDIEAVAKQFVDRVQSRLETFSKKIECSMFFEKNVLYFIWRKPYMIVGKDTFINSMLNLCTLYNIGLLIDNSSRYPKVELEQLKQIDPDLVFLSTEPYPFSEKHLPEFESLFPNSVIKIVRGDYFSWYGTRIVKAIDYFCNLFGVDCLD